MEESNDIALEQAFSIDYLQANNLQIQVKSETVGSMYIRFVITRMLCRQMSKQPKKMMKAAVIDVYPDVKGRTIDTYSTNGFNAKSIFSASNYQRYINNAKQINGTLVDVDLLDKSTGLPRHHYVVTLDKITTMNIETFTGTRLNIRKVLERRDKELQKEENATPVIIADMHSVAMEICQDFATGLFTITECCDRYGVKHLQWVEWLQNDEHIRELFKQANRVASMLNQSRQLSLIDTNLIALLNKGKYETERVNYKYMTVPGKLEPQYVITGKTVERRDLSIPEIAALKGLILKGYDFVPAQQDEIAQMSTEDLMKVVSQAKEKLGDLPNPLPDGEA